MAVVVLNATTGPTLTGTFSVITSNPALPNTPPGPQAVFTSCTLTNGATLTTTPPWSNFVDPLTTTTVRVPLGLIQSVT